MSMIFYTQLHLCKCSGSWAVSIKQNMNLNFQLPSMFVFFVFNPFKIYQQTKFYSLEFTDARFPLTSEILTSATLEWLKIWD
jgi:hypothetical protein